MAYQSFDGDNGDSDSLGKLECLRLPSDLSGKTVLDIGCNEGFFVREALRRGAARAVGVDMSPALIESARRRVPAGEFHAMSWWEIGTEKFDYILFLSAIHYEKNQRRLLNKLSYNLKPGGTLILECGVDAGSRSEEWRVVQRHDGLFRFPSLGYLEGKILESYATRVVGSSVAQSGDPMPRYVLHCSPLVPRIFAIGGYSMSGKSSFGKMLAQNGSRVIRTDGVLEGACLQLRGSKDPFALYLTENLTPGHISIFIKKMVDDGKAKEFCDFLMRFVSLDDDLTIIEGFPFTSDTILREFAVTAKAAGFRFSSTIIEGGIRDVELA